MNTTPPPSSGSHATEVQTLGDIVRRQRLERPDAIAITCNGEHVSYAELHARATRVANALRSMGAAHGSRVAQCQRNGTAYFELLFGCGLIGAVLVPINWRLSRSEIAYLLNDAAPLVLVVDAEFTEAIAAAHGAGVAVIQDADYPSWRGAAADGEPTEPVSLDAVVLQMYTSGTTGRPKGAMLSHEAVNVIRVRQRAPWSRWSDTDVCLISMPLFHIGGTGTALSSLYFGARMVIVQEFEASEFLRLIGQERITRLFLVPAAIQMLLLHPDAAHTDFGCVKHISCGSSPITPGVLADAMATFGCGLVQVYGLTESSGTVVAHPVGKGEQPSAERLRSVGQALDGVDIAIRAPDGSHVAAGVTGEVVVRSRSNMSGYWNLPQASSEAFVAGGWLRTGDLGYLDGEGFLYVIDRLKDMIISGGENVYPLEVEAAIRAIPGVRDVAVIGVPDAKWGEAVRAMVVLDDGVAFDERAFLAAARGDLAGFKAPKSVVVCESLPRNAAGKVLRRELRAPYWRDAGRQI